LGLIFFAFFGQTLLLPPLGSEDKGSQIGGYLMTNEQKSQIEQLRLAGNGYIKIAKELGISENTVKSYCRRQNTADKQGESACCAECGKPIDISKRSSRRFCSDSCRMKWWNRHPKPNMPYTAQCACCGKEISMRRRGEKKYCSHRCYILARYKDGGSNG
jgi:endogenous inhibitor of DNA gyrase (YacG/DUF329 family)